MTYSKHLASAKAYLNSKEPYLEPIIKMCSLIPSNDWRIWFDEAGNKFRIKNNKTIQTNVKNQFPKITSDLYRYAPPEDILKQSKWVLSYNGYNDKSNEYQALIFIGIDNRLRVSIFIENEWQYNLLPLSLDLKTLRFIMINKNQTNKIKHEINYIPKIYDTKIMINKIYTMCLKANTKIKHLKGLD